MRIVIGADHAGFDLKETLKAWLLERGYEVQDIGTHSVEPVDYPDYALQVAEAVSLGKAERGVLVCGTGTGMAIVANKIQGVRAAFCPDLFTARMSREHNDANILTLGGRLMGREVAREILTLWLTTEFAGGRHTPRVEKISDIEQRRS